MHRNKQDQQSHDSQITSFNETTRDLVELVKLDELNDASLAEVAGGQAFGSRSICPLKWE